MYHFIGIKGTGMSSLALVMHSLGYDVQGSDRETHFFTEDALREAGIPILPFDENNIREDLFIIQGNAFHEDHVEENVRWNWVVRFITMKKWLEN